MDQDRDHRFITLACGSCGHSRRVMLSCGSRSCPVCRKKWFGYHYKALVQIVGKWDKIYSLVLTIKNIGDMDFYKNDVRKIRADFGKLRSRFRSRIQAGFYVVQATNRGGGWHLHLHIIFRGSFIPQAEISRAWEKITGSKIVYIRILDPGQVKYAIKYLLSDFRGKPRIRPEDYYQYDQAFSGQRLVQGFGEYSRSSFNKKFVCPVCGSKKWYVLEFLEGPKPGMGKDENFFYDDPGG